MSRNWIEDPSPDHRVPCGFFLDRAFYNKLSTYLKAAGIDQHAFYRVSIAHMYFILTLKPGDDRNFFLEFLKPHKEKNHE
jgi:hypothetical protein